MLDRQGELTAGASWDAERAMLAHSGEAAARIDDIYWQELGRSAYDGISVPANEDVLARGSTLADMRWWVAHSAEAQGQLQAAFANHLGHTAGADEASGFEWAMSLGGQAYGRFTVSSAAGTVATVDARTLIAELGAYVTLSGGLTPTLTGADGQVYQFRNATELAGFALGLAVQQGYAGPAAWDVHALTVSWLAEIGQGYIQAANTLQQAAKASLDAGDLATAYLQSVGAKMAMQVQAMPPAERHKVECDVPLGALSAHVVVTGDLGDASGQAGFVFALYDPDPERAALVAHAQDYANRAAQAQAAGNQLLAYLDNCQARVDVAYANLPADVRSDKMLATAQKFVTAAYGVIAANAASPDRVNWNLVQTLEVAADVSLQIAALPVEQRHRMTERFMHENVKHDITVNPDDADPYATFTDHSKGEDLVGAIVEAVVGVVLNILAFVPVVNIVAAPLAVAWDTAQAAKSFSEGNVLGGILNLASAVGVGLSGLAGVQVVNQVGSLASDANAFAQSLGFTETVVMTSTGPVTTATAAQSLGRTILDGVAVVGGASGIAQGADRGDGLGIAAGVLQVAAGLAGGLVNTGTLGRGTELAALASDFATGARLGSVGLSASDAFLHGDLIGGLSTSLNVLLAQVAQAVAGRMAGGTPVGEGAGKPAPLDDTEDPWATDGPRKDWWIDETPPQGAGDGYQPGPGETEVPVRGEINPEYIRRAGETDEAWADRLAKEFNSLTRDVRQGGIFNPTSLDPNTKDALRQISAAIATDPEAQRNLFGKLQNLTPDAFQHPERYGKAVDSQAVGSGSYPLTTIERRLWAFTALNELDNGLRMGADGVIYSLSKESMARATEVSPLRVPYVASELLTENVNERLREFGFRGIIPDILSLAATEQLGSRAASIVGAFSPRSPSEIAGPSPRTSLQINPSKFSYFFGDVRRVSTMRLAQTRIKWCMHGLGSITL